MYEKLQTLRFSFNTNIAMAKSMLSLGHLVLAKRYLMNAKKDKQLYSSLKSNMVGEITKEYKTL